MSILESEIVPRTSSVLVGLSGETKNTLGDIKLPIYIEGVNTIQIFCVIDCLSCCNIILGRPWIHEMKAVPSTYHQCVKLPSPWGVVKTDIEQDLISFLKRIKSTFAWKHEDMTGISKDIITHKLSVDPSFRPIHQQRRKYAPERNVVIQEEVDRLLRAGMIREVKYPKWLANVVVVQKKNGKWRVCVDFTDLNKACPKDPFPLPHIDSKVDVAAGHELLTFMDASYGFQQIQMEPSDQEDTTFMTPTGIYCDTMEVYIDDMVVKSERKEDVLQDLEVAYEIQPFQMLLWCESWEIYRLCDDKERDRSQH
ncbi:hypothetical protein QVD17_37752 [Tagetes erecta]|uniref:Reverse transcriptase domain-containing protein n=1 Tax=Tagetes erecta TaxID=13708 RepID=A0AAD8JYW5_TARER|nr:hypothetical protein QVD17_37752 [Tagetes erecta]